MNNHTPAPRPPLPPFTEESARQKVQMAEDAWNTRDPERVSLAYTPDTEWRNRSEFIHGREEVVAFLTRKWERELDYRLQKTLWAFTGYRIAVRFEYEYRDATGQWYRAHGNENWEFDDYGYMARRFASINDQPIREEERKFRWPQGPRPMDEPRLAGTDFEAQQVSFPEMNHRKLELCAPDLTRRPPRSPRVRLGGYAMLPRILDKARASLSGTAGDYKYNNPMDRLFFAFTGIDSAELLEQAKSGAGDWEIFRWVADHAKPGRAQHEVRTWSAWLESMPVGDAEDLGWFAEQAKRINPARTDLQTVMDYLDADDHISFGGKA